MDFLSVFSLLWLFVKKNNVLLVYTFYRSSDFPRLGLACKRQNGYVNITTTISEYCAQLHCVL